MHLPIRLRLTLAFACGMALVLSMLGAFLYLRLGAELLRSIDMGLSSRAEVISSAARNSNGDIGNQAGSLIDPDEAFAQVLDPTNPALIVDSSSGVAGSPLVSAERLRTIASPTFISVNVVKIADTARLLVVPTLSAGHRTYVVVGAILSDRREALYRLLVLFAIGGPAALIVTSAAGWLLAGAALRPVERMRREAAAISASEPERRLPVPPTGDELARLATTLNAMLGRLQEAIGRERRFVDDASHELRTPLGIVKAELDLTLSRARTPEELEAALRRASADTNRLARLAEDLLVLSRAEGGRLPVHRVDVSLGKIVEEACDAHRREAEGAGVRLSLAAPATTVRLDPARLRQAVENLLDNAIRHTPRGGEIVVTALREDGSVRLSVEDSGPGFPEDFLERAFEPFTRADGAGGRREGAGLGLAIVRAVALAHGGTAKCENRPGGGARVTLELRA